MTINETWLALEFTLKKKVHRIAVLHCKISFWSRFISTFQQYTSKTTLCKIKIGYRLIRHKIFCPLTAWHMSWWHEIFKEIKEGGWWHVFLDDLCLPMFPVLLLATLSCKTWSFSHLPAWRCRVGAKESLERFSILISGNFRCKQSSITLPSDRKLLNYYSVSVVCPD